MNIATMTPEEKNHRIALLCGWTVSEKGWWSHPTLPDQGGAEPEPPNYYGSLDAMHEAIFAQPAAFRKAMRLHLYAITDQMSAHFANAQEVSDAFLMTAEQMEVTSAP